MQQSFNIRASGCAHKAVEGFMHVANLQSSVSSSDSDDPGAHLDPRVQQGSQQWKTPWWAAAWLAPVPTWLERLERGAPLPRLLRR
jgi:hypothetical protein